MTTNDNKRAITYSLLAHIRNNGKLSDGPLDIFIPIVKKGLQLMSNNGIYKGENVKEISSYVEDAYNITIPIPVLRNLLKIIAKEVNIKEDEEIFSVHNDDSFIIKGYIFEDYDEKLKTSKRDIDHLQKLFQGFCDSHGVDVKQNNCLIKFIEKNKGSLSYYIANKKNVNGGDFVIVAKFIEHFRCQSPTVYNQITDIYLGSILTSYLDFEPSNLKLDVDLLFDTNFIISLLDLNTPESTITCRTLLEISKTIGFSFHVLIDTIKETQWLLRKKADGFDKSIIQKLINKEDIYNACVRHKYTRVDLERIADNLELLLVKYGIIIVPNTDTYKGKAQFSPEYTSLRKYRNSHIAALHDAICITYVKEKRGNKKITEFNEANCWFVNNAISHDCDNECINSITNISHKDHFMPEIIKVDDLINILWLSSPNFNIIEDSKLVDLGLTSLIAFTLNQSLPKAQIIKELDENIQKYRSEDITDRDVYLLATRIADGQIKNIEEFNQSAITDVEKFNNAIKEQALKQEHIEKDRNKKLEDTIDRYERYIINIQQHKIGLDAEKNQIINHTTEQIESKLKKESAIDLKAYQDKQEALKKEDIEKRISSLEKRISNVNIKIRKRINKIKCNYTIISFVFIIIWISLIFIFGWDKMEIWTYVVPASITFILFIISNIYTKSLNPKRYFIKKENELKISLYKSYDINDLELKELYSLQELLNTKE